MDWKPEGEAGRTLSESVKSGNGGRGVRYWTSLLLLVGGCLCFALMHAMPITSYASGSLAGAEWSTDYGWSTWPDIVDSVRYLPSEIRAGVADTDTWLMVATIAGFVLGGILSVAAPVLTPLLRVGRLFRWLVFVVVVLAWMSGPGLVVLHAFFDPPDPEFCRWEPGVYVWMASGLCTLLGLILLPARDGARNARWAGGGVS